jgi:hypothetical protein
VAHDAAIVAGMGCLTSTGQIPAAKGSNGLVQLAALARPAQTGLANYLCFLKRPQAFGLLFIMGLSERPGR